MALFASSEVLGTIEKSVVFLPTSKKSTRRASRPEHRLLRKKPPITPLAAAEAIESDFPNVNITFFANADQNEPTVAVSPINQNIIVAGANDYRSFNALWRYVSIDGGLTWENNEMLAATDLGYATDPAVFVNDNGVFYYSYGRLSAGGLPYPRNDVVCYRSGDGKDFGLPRRVFFDSSLVDYNSANILADKYFLTIDRSTSQYNGRIYVVWAEYESGKSRIVSSFSSDEGETWSSPLNVSQADKYQCPIPIVTNDGNVYVSYLNLNAADHTIYVTRLTNGGATLAETKAVSPYRDIGRLYPPTSNDPHPVIKGHLRVNSFPSIASYGNNLYLVWAAKGDDEKHHIYFSVGSNIGSNWTTPRAIENDNGLTATDKFFPWIAVDKTNGDIGIVFYDSRNDSPANQKIDLYMAHSNDSGASFAVQRISDISFDPIATSSLDSLAKPDTLSFFGDYIAVDAVNKVWHPVWTDSRIGYDQDLYTARVRPYAPAAVKKFTATENTTEHFAHLDWEYDPATTFGRPIGNFQFRLTRDDGGVDVLLASSSRNYDDLSSSQTADHRYRITVVTADGDTSLTRTVLYSPIASRKSIPPVITYSEAVSNGTMIEFHVPNRTVSLTELRGLKQLYFIVDGTVFDSISLGDGQQGMVFSRNLILPTETYHNIQLQVLSERDGFVTHSDLSNKHWLYSGAPYSIYSENFESSRDVFSTSSWDTTRISLPSSFINDSLPNIPYQSGKNSWFLLPATTLSSLAHTLEFDHVALVAPQDSAIIEVSLNNGLSFEKLRSYNVTSEPTMWGDELSSSQTASDSIAMKWWIGNTAVVRFRLHTESPLGDGWFIDNIRFSDKLSIEQKANHLSTFRASIDQNPVSRGSLAQLTIETDESVRLSVRIFDVTGKNTRTVFVRRGIQAGEYTIEFPCDQAGVFFYEVIAESPSITEKRFGKIVVH